jgi:hypothetical protein
MPNSSILSCLSKAATCTSFCLRQAVFQTYPVLGGGHDLLKPYRSSLSRYRREDRSPTTLSFNPSVLASMDVGGILVYDRDSFTRRKEHGRRRRTRLVCSEMDMHSDRNMQRAGDLDHIGQELFACELYVPLLAETDQLVAPFWKHFKLGPDAFEMMYHIAVRTQSLLFIEFMVPNAQIQLLVVLPQGRFTS